MPKEEMPSAITLDEATIVTYYPGASPEEVESLITDKIEEEIADLKDIDYIASWSREGVSYIRVQYEIGIEYDEAISELRTEVAKVTQLPEGAEKPEIFEVRGEEIFPVAAIAISATLPHRDLKQIAEDLEEELLAIDGVAKVYIEGLKDREIQVKVDQAKLTAHNLSLTDVVYAIRTKSLNIPAGKIKFGREELLVKTEEEFGKISEIGETVIKRGIKIADVAEVADAYKEEEKIVRVDGKGGAFLWIIKEREGDVFYIMKEAMAIARRFSENFQIDFTIYADSSDFIRDKLGIIKKNAALGMVIVILLLWYAIGIRNAIMVGIGIPFTFLVSFCFMHFYGITITVITLFSLLLVLGIIVDDAIIVVENCHRHLERGVSKKEAVQKGAEEIMWPVVCTVLTTAAAFSPILLMTGIMGKFMGYIPKVVIFALLASLIEALIVLPAHLSEFGKVEVQHPMFKRVLSSYRKLLKTALRYRYLTVLAVLVIASASVLLAFRLERKLFDHEDTEQAVVQIEMAEGVSLKETDRIVREIEKMIAQYPKTIVESFCAKTGQMIKNYEFVEKPNVAEITIQLTKAEERDISDVEFIEELREKLSKIVGPVSLTCSYPQEGPPTGPPVDIRIKGDNFDKLKEIAEEVKAYLSTIEGVTDIQDDFREGKKEIKLKVDEEEANLFGISCDHVARLVRCAVDGELATTFTEGTEEIDVVVKLSSTDIEDLLNLQICRVKLRDIAEIERKRAPSEIRHRDRERVIGVSANIDRRITTPTEVNKKIEEHFAHFSLKNPGYSIELGGEFAETQESFASLYKAFFVAILLIYCILAGLFKSFAQPLIVIFAVPFCFIGVVLGLYIMGYAFTVPALVGVIGLAGVVVNDSLILVDFINRERACGVSRWRSLLSAGCVRMRPVFLTSATTIGGLLPLSFGILGSSPMWQPMATAFCWGLAFATGLTLLLIPSLYAIVDDMKERLSKHRISRSHLL
jgi:multidrug efflux pump subunit AcrB